MPRYDAVPQALKDEQRWLTWALKGDKKPPCDDQGYPLADWKSQPLTYEAAMARLKALPFPSEAPSGALNAGLGLIAQSGVDLDNCYTEDGQLDPRAKAIIDMIPGWAERSPSGKGIKVFFVSTANNGAGEWVEVNFGVSPITCEIKKPLYFALSGGEVVRDGDPTADGTRAIALVSDMFGSAGARVERKQAPRLNPEGGKVQAGGQEKALFTEACRLRRNGWVENEIAAALWGLVTAGRFPAEQGKTPWTYSDCAAKAKSACRYAAGDAPPVDFEMNKDGKIIPSPENIRAAVSALGITLCYDEFRQQEFIRHTDDGELKPLDDHEVNKLRFKVSKLWLLFPKELWYDMLSVIAKENCYHPVRQYLASLEWDETERIGTWLSTYGGAADTALNRAVGRLVLKAAVKRIFEPGCMFQELVVLESPQGKNKSSALRALMPNPDWFTDNLPLGVDTKMTIERTSGIWLVEFAEMAGLSKKEAEHVKTFMSTQVDGPVRMSYARKTITLPRQWVAIGSTNRKNYLKDVTGGRRFWPVEVGTFDVEAVLRDRDQLWAEAVVALKQDNNVRLDRSLWEDARVIQDDHAENDDWFDALEERLHSAGPGRVTIAQVRDVIGRSLDSMTQSDSFRLGGYMAKLGFVKRSLKVGGRAIKGYVRIPDGKREDNIKVLPWLLGDPGLGDQGNSEQEAF